jgi:hypothetical protein
MSGRLSRGSGATLMVQVMAPICGCKGRIVITDVDTNGQTRASDLLSRRLWAVVPHIKLGTAGTGSNSGAGSNRVTE